MCGQVVWHLLVLLSPLSFISVFFFLQHYVLFQLSFTWCQIILHWPILFAPLDFICPWNCLVLRNFIKPTICRSLQIVLYSLINPLSVLPPGLDFVMMLFCEYILDNNNTLKLLICSEELKKTLTALIASQQDAVTNWCLGSILCFTVLFAGHQMVIWYCNEYTHTY